MAPLEIYQFPCLSDNYGVLIHDPDSGATGSIDTPEAAAVDNALAAKGWTLTHILNTHHHHDHTGGNLELKNKYNCTIVGPSAEGDRIPGIDQAVGHGETYDFAGHEARIIETPGHTLGHIAYHFADDGVAFVGDTLFALGCGRVFEGNAQQMWMSLERLLAMPDDTIVYCGHEYTEANARFSVTVDPSNTELQSRVTEIAALRADGKPTVPTTMAVEKATNPFLRPADPAIRTHLGLVNAENVDVFAEIRRRKDNF